MYSFVDILYAVLIAAPLIWLGFEVFRISRKVLNNVCPEKEVLWYAVSFILGVFWPVTVAFFILYIILSLIYMAFDRLTNRWVKFWISDFEDLISGAVLKMLRVKKDTDARESVISGIKADIKILNQPGLKPFGDDTDGMYYQDKDTFMEYDKSFQTPMRCIGINSESTMKASGYPEVMVFNSQYIFTDIRDLDDDVLLKIYKRLDRAVDIKMRGK